jgi:hypothetical protein
MKNIFRLLTVAHRRNLILLLIVPLFIYFTWAMVKDSVLDYASSSPAISAVDNINETVAQKSYIYTILQDSER